MKKGLISFQLLFLLVISLSIVVAQEPTEIDTAGAYAAIIAFFGVFIIFILAGTLGVYIYAAIAWMSLAKKAGNTGGAWAWFPIFGGSIVGARISKSSYWPIYLPALVLIASIVILFIPRGDSNLNGWLFVLLLFVALPISVLIYFIYWFIWRYKSFEAGGHPGGLIFLVFIPGVGVLIYLIMLGVVAWSKENTVEQVKVEPVVQNN